jgi:hypothetical protein
MLVAIVSVAACSGDETESGALPATITESTTTSCAVSGTTTDDGAGSGGWTRLSHYERVVM